MDDLTAHKGPARTDPEIRFWRKVDKRGPDECWPWTAAHNGRGYAVFGAGGRGNQVYAHRWAYGHFLGPIPEGMEVDHTCHDPAVCKPAEPNDCPHRRCVNPAHLELVTRGENCRRGDTGWGRQNRAKTHCKKGHEYTPANTRLYRQQQGGVGRSCRTCSREFSRLYRIGKKAQSRTN